MNKSNPFTRLIKPLVDAHERHRDRHRSTGFQFALADSIDFINHAHWDSVVNGQSFFMQRPYLKFVETCSPENLLQRYALIFERGIPIAAVIAQMLQLNATHITPKSKSIKKAALSRMKARILSCGNCLSWGLHGVVFAQGRESPETWLAVAEALYRIRRADRLLGQVELIMVKDIPSNVSPTVQALRRISYRSVETEPDMVLEFAPNWRRYEDYLAGLNSKYRKTVVKLDKQVQEAGCSIEPLKNLQAHRDRLHELYLQVHDSAELRLVTLQPDYLPALANVAAESFRCTVIRQQNKLLGFVTTLKDRDTAIGYYIGYDREENAKIPIYLRLLQAVVADAFELGCRRISFGRTALEPKARLGAKPVPMQIWVRHRQSLVNAIAREFLHLIQPAKAPDRNPFGQGSESS